MKKTLIFTATLNEYPNIKILLDRILALNMAIDILIIDDASTDGTLEFLRNYSLKNGFFKLIERKSKLGLDTAHKLAYRYARENRYDNLITMDADLSHEPELIPKFISLLEIENFVLGSRYIFGGNCDLKGLRLFLSIYGNLFIKKFLKINSSEFTTSFRGFCIKRLNNFDLEEVKSSGYSFFMETIFLINKLGINIHQLPIHFKSRKSGKSKIPKIEIFRTLYNAFRLRFFNKN